MQREIKQLRQQLQVQDAKMQETVSLVQSLQSKLEHGKHHKLDEADERELGCASAGTSESERESDSERRHRSPQRVDNRRSFVCALM